MTSQTRSKKLQRPASAGERFPNEKTTALFQSTLSKELSAPQKSGDRLQASEKAPASDEGPPSTQVRWPQKRYTTQRGRINSLFRSDARLRQDRGGRLSLWCPMISAVSTENKGDSPLCKLSYLKISRHPSSKWDPGPCQGVILRLDHFLSTGHGQSQRVPVSPSLGVPRLWSRLQLCKHAGHDGRSFSSGEAQVPGVRGGRGKAGGLRTYRLTILSGIFLMFTSSARFDRFESAYRYSSLSLVDSGLRLSGEGRVH